MSLDLHLLLNILAYLIELRQDLEEINEFAAEKFALF